MRQILTALNKTGLSGYKTMKIITKMFSWPETLSK